MEPGDVVADRFVIEAWAGVGGMGEVYRARDREDAGGAPVALKVLRNAARDAARFAREVAALRGLRHPAIVRYIADGTTPEGAPWLAMEWVEGEDLAMRLARGPLAPADALALVRRVAEGLGAAHARGLVHRDVKPSNLMLRDGAFDRVVLLDFGIATALGTSHAGLTRTGTVIGTLGYMAPEQARADRGVDARADVFALGCVLYECLCGQVPFAGEHPAAVLAKILFDDPVPLRVLAPAVPRELAELVARMLAKSPHGRPADGAAVARALDELAASGAPIPAQVPSAPPALTSLERRLVGVVLVRAPAGHAGAGLPAAAAATVPLHDPVLARCQAAANAHGGRCAALADGSVVVLVTGDAAPDVARRAARCALALRDAVPAERAVALATGRAVVAHGGLPVGEAIDRAAALAGAAHRASPAAAGGTDAQGVRVDEVTAGLLDARFEVGGEHDEVFVRRERETLHDDAATLRGDATPCVGRDAELADLVSEFETCASEPEARALVLVGGAGAGKTRLRRELLARLGARARCLLARGDALRTNVPLAALAVALEREVGAAGEAPHARRAQLRERVARSVADGGDAARVADFLGEVVGTPFPDDTRVQLRVARQDPRVMADQIQRAWIDWLSAETLAGPVVLVLEDLHWADHASVALLDATLRRLWDRPLFVLGLARPEVRARFPELWADRGARSVELPPLRRRASEALVRNVLGPLATPERVGDLVERGGGNPFVLEEMARALAHGMPLPATALAAAEARLMALEPDARQVLRAASVFGRAFWLGGVLALLGPAARDAGGWLAVLAEREVVARRGAARFAAEPEYEFRSALLRDAAYATLTEADRAVGHALAGAWLAQAGEPDAAVLAEHFARGGDPARAAEYYLQAAEQDLARRDPAGALARADEALASLAAGEPAAGGGDDARRAVRAGALVVGAMALRWRGAAAEAMARAREAMACAEAGSALWCRAAHEVASTCGVLGARAELATLLAELAPWLARDAHGPVASAAAIAVSESWNGGLAAQAAPLHRALVEAPRAQDPALRARVERMCAEKAAHEGRPDAYARWMAAACASYVEAGDVRGACFAQVYLGFGYAELGAHEEAERCLRAGLATAEQLGLTHVATGARSTLGFARACQGALAEAERLASEAAAAYRAQRDARGEATARADLARIALLQRDPARAEQAASAAVECAGSVDAARVYALAVRALVRAEAGRAREALADAEQARALDAATAAGALSETLVRLAHAEALFASGEAHAAREAIAAARARVLARADAIEEPRWRESFLAAVPENARTLALAAAWSTAASDGASDRGAKAG